MTRHLPEKARREQILSAARRCFVDQGYHPTRMDDIAKAANLSKGGVYFHFKSKQEVFNTLVEEEFRRTMDYLHGVLEDRERTVLERIARLGDVQVEDSGSSQDVPRFFLVMGEMALRDESLANRLLEMQTAYVDMVAKLIEQGRAEGVLKDVNPREAALLFKAVLDGWEGLAAIGYPMKGNDCLGSGISMMMDGLRGRGSRASTPLTGNGSKPSAPATNGSQPSAPAQSVAAGSLS